ncbi:hypothetical protein SGQ83_22185 [Flavobacterium sp. Fl-318]|uniref:Uncharacterized protein n=1 Tax=Flavobacterium cupriresistens TaxID=2893885 RepID=A0ABU4RHP0_9FLAO|nr:MULTISPECIES: hypothetical protein [unclassified Flavobacterium]MDX6192065.1 hypothetical protein [Flavobacterium sp. Fl-318]UFH44679.1 hypothetical protein LNP23_10875 [Flavobacterium sp. F-323]
MIENLIRKTNTPEFYQDSDLKLESYNYKTSANTLELFFSINQISYDIPIEYEEWKITCLKTEQFEGFFWDLLLPYVKIKILDSHPLLLKYHESQLECLVKGKPKNLNLFVGDISNGLEKKTGNWIKVNEVFWNNEENFKLYPKRHIRIPKSLKSLFAEVCKEHDLEFDVTNELIGEDKGYCDKPKAKILIFGNEDVSDNDFSLNQPFIIAEEFIAERVK